MGNKKGFKEEIRLSWAYQIDGWMEGAKIDTIREVWKNTSLDSTRETEIRVNIIR